MSRLLELMWFQTRIVIDLNDLALLLRATNRLTEAEPLSQRAVEIVLKFRKATRHEHPHQRAFVGVYEGLLQAMALSVKEIRRRMEELLAKYRADED